MKNETQSALVARDAAIILLLIWAFMQALLMIWAPADTQTTYLLLLFLMDIAVLCGFMDRVNTGTALAATITCGWVAYKLYSFYAVGETVYLTDYFVTVLPLLGSGAAALFSRSMRHCCAFHLRTLSIKCLYQIFLLFLAGNKLISAEHSSGKCLNVRIHFFVYFHCQLHKLLICRERKGIHSRNLSYRIAKHTYIHVVLNCICRNHDIPDVDICIQRTCHTCIDQRIHTKTVNQNLCADSHVDFSDTTSYNYNFLAAHNTFDKSHSGTFHRILNFHRFL